MENIRHAAHKCVLRARCPQLAHTAAFLSRYDDANDDGSHLTPSDIHSYLGRVMYNKRNKFDPFWNELVVAGYKDGKG